MSAPAQPSSPRNDALDVARFVAAFGVILIHCGPTTPAAGRVVTFFQNFAVPFFLLSSLYLFWREALTASGPRVALLRRLPRLLWPYAIWSLVYYTARLGKAALQGAPLEPLLTSDALFHVAGAGGASVQLYFLPLLLCGFLVAAAVASLTNSTAPASPILGALLAAGIFLNLLPPLVPSAAGPVAKLLLTYAGWVVLLIAPVCAAGLLAHRWKPAHAIATRGTVALAAFAVVDGLATFGLLPGAPLRASRPSRAPRSVSFWCITCSSKRSNSSTPGQPAAC
jgi:peptidoglycan/LPS O-acetylase OafA/YrhL